MLFRSMDVDSDGRVLKPELSDYLTRFYEPNLCQEKTDVIMSNLDMNNSKSLEFSELRVAGMSSD